MPERRGEKKSADPFEQYRNSESTYWRIIEPSVKNVFGDRIPDEFRPHLIELTVIRGGGHAHEIEKDVAQELISQFSDAHDRFFDNSLFINAVRTISERFPLAG